MTRTDTLILVTGATGTQGGAAALSLLEAGFRVRALVRNPDSDNARTLAGNGVELAKGDWNDQASLLASLDGAYGVFSVQRPDTDGSDSERRHGFALINAAREAGVRHFVHTSVCEAGKHTAFPRWESGYWGRSYWRDKWDVEEAVRSAGFSFWTVLKPAFIMENYIAPKVDYMFPHLREGKILSALLPSSRLQLIAAESIGAFARAALCEPQRFNGQNIDLAADALTMAEVAATLQEVVDKPVLVQSLDPDSAKEAGLAPGWVRTQEWINETGGYKADIEALKSWGIPLLTFSDWAKQYAGDFAITGETPRP